MGGSADDSTTALSAGGLGQGSRGEARVGAAASEVLAVTDAAVLLEATENNGSPASAAGRGIAPKVNLQRDQPTKWVSRLNY